MSGKRTRASADRARDRRIAAGISTWFSANARDLPWRIADPLAAQRSTIRDPYHALVAEAMLQQTQVSRVVERYPAFIVRFPTVHALAGANESDVLAMWSGMGYYRRARNLHAAAKMIVTDFAGVVPRNLKDLQRLPGVGRYTAGAIASIAFGEAAPIVDGNVARVLLRIEGRDVPIDDKAALAWLWQRAESLVASAQLPGTFNEGLMELGATVCAPAPAMPRCAVCPVRATCAARREGRQREIPRPRKRAARTSVFCGTVIVRRTDGSLLVERRPGRGMWAGLWQAPTLERSDRAPTVGQIARAVDLPARSLTAAGTFEFLATHRRVVFEVRRASVGMDYAPRRGEFRPPEDIPGLGMGSAQRQALQLGA